MNTKYIIKEVSMTCDLKADLQAITSGYSENKIFLICESTTWENCWPLIKDFRPIPESNLLILKPGEEHKNMEQVMTVWEWLGQTGADRSSLVINIGGGMLTDLGGFAACTFKRGIPYINIPTTVLAMVDASTGGKTGVNFRGLKNEIGVIRQPWHVFLYLPFLNTLDHTNLLSGYAEMLKAGLIADQQLWAQLRDFNLDHYDADLFGKLIWQSVEIKRNVVEIDPEEHGIRKALNFGHTIGHALESESLHSGHPLPHGFAVAFGMIMEARLSQKVLGLPAESVEEITETLMRLYGAIPAAIYQPDVMLKWMKFDKKNRDNKLIFTLLNKIGSCQTDIIVDADEIRTTLVS